MESTARAVGQLLPSYTPAAAHLSSSTGSRISCGSVCIGRIRSGSEVLTFGFCDRSHLQYYGSKFGSMGRMSVISEKHEKKVNDKPLKKMKKKQLKLLKGLTRDLSTLSQIGFGLDSDGALLDQVKGNMISEATEILLQRLQKIKAEEKELKKKRKEEKARSKTATIKQIGVNCEVSSSSSSDSSDGECGEIIDMNTLKHSHTAAKEQTSTYAAPVIPMIPSIEDEKMDLRLSIEDTCLNSQADPSGFVFPTCSKKIEVCMGGKCRKAGGGALLEEFQRAVGTEGAVSGCKCMGKCKEGPNVRVVNGLDGGEVDIPAKAPANSLCIGVGLEDVNTIVANLLSENQCQLAAAASSASN